ncbi:hypothetical protein DT075_24705 [Bacillus licheniformis]|nr:hypothetical protein DT075_24705 [Bacillus licheniformis]
MSACQPYAVRDTNIDGIDIKKGDFMGILNGKIVETASDQLTAAKKLIAGMIDEDSEIVTVIKGEDAPEEEAFLPNNSNIVMAANQAADVAGQHVIVIPTKTVPQGMAALLAFNPALSADENEAAMLGAIGEVKSGQI